ncbi:hypothetical protein GGI13_002516 [Coemansia sp. RSA 455]|nr:hypothetical protein GGI13_002516 [Coemansia sp. RSA 455]
MQLSKLLACKMQPGDKQGRTFTAKFKSLSSDMQALELTHAQLMALIYISALNNEFRSVATYFGTMRPSSFTLNKVATMVCEHMDTLLAGVGQDSESFAGASYNSGNIVCQYCKKSGHTADKCFGIANLKNKPKSDDSGSSSKYTNGAVVVKFVDCISPSLFPVIVTGRPCVALFDSGCTEMVLGERFADSIPHVVFTKPLWFVSLLASVADQRKVGTSRIAMQLHIVAGPTSNYYNCIVTPVCYELFVGVPWVICNNAHVNWDQRLLWTRFGAIPEFVPASQGKGREPEDPEIAYIDVSSQDELWEHAATLYDLHAVTVINSVETQESPTSSVPVHPLATKFAELYKDRLHDELPDELPPRCLQDP